MQPRSIIQNLPQVQNIIPEMFPNMLQQDNQNTLPSIQDKHHRQDFQNFRIIAKKAINYCSAKASKHEFVSNARLRQVRRHKEKMLTILKQKNHTQTQKLGKLQSDSQKLINGHQKQKQLAKKRLEYLRNRLQENVLNALKQSSIRRDQQQEKLQIQKQTINKHIKYNGKYIQKNKIHDLIQNFYSLVTDFENQVEQLDYKDRYLVESLEKSFKKLLEIRSSSQTPQILTIIMTIQCEDKHLEEYDYQLTIYMNYIINKIPIIFFKKEQQLVGTIATIKYLMPKFYHTTNFWEEKYKTTCCEHYEWLANLHQIIPILKQHGLHENNREKSQIKILQLGCGTSKISDRLFAFGFQNIKCIDFSKEVIKNRKKKSENGIQYVCQDILELKQQQQYYDYIIDKCTIDCVMSSPSMIKDVLTIMRRLFKTLKPKGKVIIFSQGKPKMRKFLFSNILAPFHLKYFAIKKDLRVATESQKNLTIVSENINFCYILRKTKDCDAEENNDIEECQNSSQQNLQDQFDKEQQQCKEGMNQNQASKSEDGQFIQQNQQGKQDNIEQQDNGFILSGNEENKFNKQIQGDAEQDQSKDYDDNFDGEAQQKQQQQKQPKFILE